MTTGPGIVDRVVVVRRVVDGAGAGATVVLVLLVTVVVDVDVVPAARVRSVAWPPRHAERARRPRAVSVRRTHLVSANMDLRVMLEPQQGATYDQQLAIAQAAEAEGFDGFFRSDHLMRFDDEDPGPGPTESWITLAGIARETTRIRLGTLVTSMTFRLPGMLAITVAEVDAMSGGRVELGLGTGWFDPEHHAHGLPFPPLGQRFEMLEEQLQIILGMWATPPGERFSFEGKHYRVVDSPGLPKPVQRPHPPIIMGGAGS